MSDLVHTRFFGLLAEPSQEVTNEEMQNAYGQFVEQVNAVGSSNDNATAFRTLNITRIELSTIGTVHRYEQGKNALKKAYLQKAIWYLESEIDLLKLTFHSSRQPFYFRQCRFRFSFPLEVKEYFQIFVHKLTIFKIAKLLST